MRLILAPPRGCKKNYGQTYLTVSPLVETQDQTDIVLASEQLRMAMETNFNMAEAADSPL